MTILRATCLSLVVGAAACVGPGPADAQWFGGYNTPAPYGYGGYGYARPLPPDEIIDRIEDQGFEDVRRVRREGSVYVAEATSEGGVKTRVTVDAYRGRILDRRPLLAGYPEGGYSRLRSPYEEMPESEMRRRGLDGSGAFREAARPSAPEPARPPMMNEPAPPPAGGLAAPADPRLAPRAAGRETPKREPRREPRREAARSSEEVDGVNPDSRPATRRSASKPAAPSPSGAGEPTPRTPSGAGFLPVAPPAAAKAAPEPARPVEAENRAPKPIRVIGGVTQMNQSGSPPQNQSDTPKPAATPPN